MLHDDIAKRLRIGIYRPGYLASPPSPPPRERGRQPGGLLDELAGVHEAAHATFSFINHKIYDVSVERGGHGGGEFRSVPNARDAATDPKEAAGELIGMMVAALDPATARAWLNKLIGTACGRAAQRRYGARHPSY